MPPVLREIPNSRHRSVMASPSSNRATKRRRSSTTEDSFQGIGTSRQRVVAGEKCYPCLRYDLSPISRSAQQREFTTGGPLHIPASKPSGQHPVSKLYLCLRVARTSH